MKNILKNILATILLTSTFSLISHAQIKKVDEFMIKENYLNDFEKVIIKPCCSGEEPSDLSFSGSTGIVLSNHDLIQLARERALNAWFRRQHDLMRREIGKRFNKSYPNFEQARNDYFKHWERKSILKAANNTRREFSTKVRRRSNFKEKKIRNLKLLDLRKREIDLGNINNSNFSSFKINDTPISSITSLSQLNSLRDQEVSSFGNNEYRLHNDRVIYHFANNDIMGDMGLYSNRFNFNYPILNSILHLQINHYNTIGNGLPYHHSWYQLDLMQQYLNNVTYPVPQIPPRVSPGYFGHDDYIRRFALNQNRNNISIFDPNYEEHVVHRLAAGMSWEELDRNERDLTERAIVIIEREQKEYINSLLDQTDITTEFNTSKLNSEQLRRFNQARQRLSDNCLGAALLSAVSNANIEMGTTAGNNGEYHPRTNTIKFNGNEQINYNILGAELLHAYQQQLYGVLDDIVHSNRVGGSNIEFEEKAFNLQRDLIDGMGIAMFPGEEGLVDWLTNLEINHPGNDEIVLTQVELDDWFEALEVFRQFHQGNNNHYGDPVDTSLKPDAIINLINKTRENNCN